MKLILCDPKCEKCVDGESEVCSAGTLFYREVKEALPSKEEIVYYRRVPGDKYPEKSMRVGTGQEVAEEFAEQIKAFKRHNFNRIRQHIMLQHLTGSVPGTNCVIQVDFSENYSNKQKNEIPSAYFGHESFTIYTVCVWFGEGEEVKC